MGADRLLSVHILCVLLCAHAACSVVGASLHFHVEWSTPAACMGCTQSCRLGTQALLRAGIHLMPCFVSVSVTMQRAFAGLLCWTVCMISPPKVLEESCLSLQRLRPGMA